MIYEWIFYKKCDLIDVIISGNVARLFSANDLILFQIANPLLCLKKGKHKPLNYSKMIHIFMTII